MSAQQWSESLELGLPFMDSTHSEFMALLNAFIQMPNETGPVTWLALIEHTEQHFSREDRWMEKTGFSPSNCHTLQHRAILQIMREVSEREQKGEEGILLQTAEELSVWFVHHVQTMDAGLALHLNNLGYDSTTDSINVPEALPKVSITGCGSVICSSTHD